MTRNPWKTLRVNSTALQRTDWAYLCYAWFAGAVWFEPVVDVLPIGPDYRQFLFMLLWVPVTLSIVGASLMAFIYSVQERREWPLLVMMAILASMVALFLAGDVSGMDMGAWEQLWYAAGSSILLLLVLRWFLVRKAIRT